jgi:hypothetical protein
VPDRGSPDLRARELLVVGLGATLATLLYLAATPARLAGALVPDLGDPAFNLYVLRWVAHQATLGFPDLWNAPFYFPAHGTLALSDHLLSAGLLTALLQALGATPAFAYNLLLVGSFALGAVAMHTVARRSGFSPLASAFGAFVYSFSLFRWNELSHLQVLLVPLYPWCFWNFDRLLAERTPRRALWFLLAYLPQVAAGSYGAYLLHVGFLGIVVARWRELRERPPSRREGLALGSAALVAGAAAAAVFAPYLRLRATLGVDTPISWLAPFRLTLRHLVAMGARVPYADLVPQLLRSDTGLWVGFVPAALAIFGALPALREARARLLALPRRRLVLLVACAVTIGAAILAADFATVHFDFLTPAGRRPALRVYKIGGTLALTALALLVALWPRRDAGGRRDPWLTGIALAAGIAALAAHPLAYFLLREALPGFGSLRVAARFFLVVAPALSLLVAAGVDRLAAAFGEPLTRRRVLVGAALLLALEAAPRGDFMVWQEIPAPDKPSRVDRAIAEIPGDGAIAEIPFFGDWREAMRMYKGSFHWRPLVNGYSGYYPRGFLAIRQHLLAFPDRETAAWLSELGVSHLAIDGEALGQRGRKRDRNWRQRATDGETGWLDPVMRDGRLALYRIRPPAARR